MANSHQTDSDQQKQGVNPDILMDSGQVISYNIDEDERPGGVKVRFKIQIVTGKHAAALDERQAEAIRELLAWTRHCRTQPPPSR